MAGNQEIFIVGLDGNLWLAEGPFGNVPPKRVPVDVNVMAGYGSILGFNSSELLVLGSDSHLWLERGPFGNLPWVEADQFPPPKSQRWHIDGSVYDFYPWTSEGPFFIVGNDYNLWHEDPN